MTEKTKKVFVGVAKAGIEVTKFVGELTIPILTCGVARAILPPGVNAVIQGGALVGGLLLGAVGADRVDKFLDESIESTIENAKDKAERVKRDIDILRDNDIKEETEENNIVNFKNE